MFPSQMVTDQSTRLEIEQHCNKLLGLATSIVEDNVVNCHSIVFATLLAGSASINSESKRRAIQLVHAMEGRGISRNATRTRELLIAVCEEQRKCVLAGSRQEEVDMIALAKARGLEAVDFGL